jgi:hypothetical protein
MAGHCSDPENPVLRKPASRGFFFVASVGALFSFGLCGKCHHPSSKRPYGLLADYNGGRIMRLLIVCAIVITAGVGLAGCFHHEQAVVAEPISHPPLK